MTRPHAGAHELPKQTSLPMFLSHCLVRIGLLQPENAPTRQPDVQRVVDESRQALRNVVTVCSVDKRAAHRPLAKAKVAAPPTPKRPKQSVRRRHKFVPTLAPIPEHAAAPNVGRIDPAPPRRQGPALPASAPAAYVPQLRQTLSRRPVLCAAMAVEVAFVLDCTLVSRRLG